jgi:hypothetical protein
MNDISLVGEARILIEPGIYAAVLTHHETNNVAFGGQPKVYLRFVLLDPGVMGVKLYAAFNVKAITGKPRLNGGIKLSHRQELTFQLARLQPNVRLDRLSLKPLHNKEIKIKVRTVTTDSRQRPLPSSLQYSVVSELISLMEPLTHDQ